MISDSTTVRVPATAGLEPGRARVFSLPDSDEQGFVIRTTEGLRAFRNRCRHWPVPLDLDDADFWNADLGMVQCKVHGALFRPDDGLCLAGPCAGSPLESFEVREDGPDCLVDIPAARPKG